MNSTPIYRALPPSGVKTFAGLRYLSDHGTPQQVTDFIRRSAGPSRYSSTAVVGAQAALRSGADDVLETLLADGLRRFPEDPGLLCVRAELAAFRGDHATALADARRARFAAPSTSRAAALEVRFSYQVEDEATSDEVAVGAVRRFPQAAGVLWAAGKECRSPEQYGRLVSAWEAKVPEPRDLTVVVRQLGTAAGRAGLTDEAIGWYERAMRQLLDGTASPPPVRDAQLAGKGAWQAIVDLVDLFDGADIPYFFAAGTALGLVREGRPLSADGDIDVGVFDEDYDFDQLRELFRAHPGFDFDVVHPSTKKLGLRHRGGSPVDIFRFYEDDGRLWHDAVFVRWTNSPFTIDRLEVGGISAPIPADRERYLVENYGESWRVPASGFDAFTDDAPNVETTWPAYLDLHLVRRAYKRLTAGDMVAAARDLHAAGREEFAREVEGAGRA